MDVPDRFHHFVVQGDGDAAGRIPIKKFSLKYVLHFMCLCPSVLAIGSFSRHVDVSSTSIAGNSYVYSPVSHLHQLLFANIKKKKYLWILFTLKLYLYNQFHA